MRTKWMLFQTAMAVTLNFSQWKKKEFRPKCKQPTKSRVSLYMCVRSRAPRQLARNICTHHTHSELSRGRVYFELWYVVLCFCFSFIFICECHAGNVYLCSRAFLKRWTDFFFFGCCLPCNSRCVVLSCNFIFFFQFNLFFLLLETIKPSSTAYIQNWRKHMKIKHEKNVSNFSIKAWCDAMPLK